MHQHRRRGVFGSLIRSCSGLSIPVVVSSMSRWLVGVSALSGGHEAGPCCEFLRCRSSYPHGGLFVVVKLVRPRPPDSSRCVFRCPVCPPDPPLNAVCVWPPPLDIRLLMFRSPLFFSCPLLMLLYFVLCGALW